MPARTGSDGRSHPGPDEAQADTTTGEQHGAISTSEGVTRPSVGSRRAADALFPDRPVQRLTRCIVGLAFFGLGISMFVTAGLGSGAVGRVPPGRLEPHRALALGWVIEIVGFVLLLLWIPLRQRPGVGTILNAVEIGLVVNLIGDHLPSTDRLIPRVVLRRRRASS